MREFGPPPAPLHCPACRSWHVTVDIDDRGDPDVRIMHLPRCRTRRNPVLRKRAELAIIGRLAETMFIADYSPFADGGGVQPRHGYLQVAT